jgi:cysteine synthase A
MSSGISYSFGDIIGNTPLYHLQRWGERVESTSFVFGKLEFMNPIGGIKARAALEMIETAEKQGILREGTTIVEATSGNTGISLAAVAKARGYHVLLTMPESASEEWVRLLTAYGAEVVLTDASLGTKGAVDKTKELLRTVQNAVLLRQFANMANVTAHYKSTGPEIWESTRGRVDLLVAGVGTGATITGTAKYLKEQNPKLMAIAVEPAESPLLSKGQGGAHEIQGLGPNFYPKILDTSLLDDVISVTKEQAYQSVRDFLDTEGMLVGISSGAALYATAKLSAAKENSGKNIVVVLPDSGERYLSTGCFED